MLFLGPAAEASPAETQHSGDTVDHHQDQLLAIPVILLALGGQPNATFLLVPEFRCLNHVDSNILIFNSHQLKLKSHTKFEGSIPHWLLPEGKKGRLQEILEISVTVLHRGHACHQNEAHWGEELPRIGPRPWLSSCHCCRQRRELNQAVRICSPRFISYLIIICVISALP